MKQSAADALSTLSFKGPSTQLAIASGLVQLIGQGSADSQEQATQLLLHLSHDPVNCKAVAKAGAVPRLVQQMKGGGAGSADDYAKEASRPASHSGCRRASLWLRRSTGAPAVLRC